MLIYDEDLIKIQIYFKQVGHNFLAHTASEFEKLKLKDDKKAKFSEVNIKMAPLTFSLQNQLQEEAMVDDNTGSGDRRFNYKLFKENKLIKLIKEWDATGKEKKPVPVSKSSIEHLAPSIAETILRGYDEASTVTEEEEKNS